MSEAFTQFLREQSVKHEAKAQSQKAVIDEWRGAVGRLFNQLRNWMHGSDPDGIIQIEEAEHEVTEPGLGRYRISRLDLRGLGKWIGVIPKAFKTVGTAHPPQKSAPERAAGRVDITDELRRYVLYRFPQDGAADLWMIDDLRTEPKPLDQQAFEAALMSYLR